MIRLLINWKAELKKQHSDYTPFRGEDGYQQRRFIGKLHLRIKALEKMLATGEAVIVDSLK